MNPKWAKIIAELGLNPNAIKLRLTLTILTSIGLAIVGYIFSTLMVALIVFSLGIVLTISQIQTINNQYTRHQRVKEGDFVEAFTYFRIYINHGRNVYQALALCRDQAKPTLTNDFENLLSALESDQSIQPFITFASQFPNPLIQEVLIAIYQMIDGGNEPRYLWQFNYLFSSYGDQVAEKTFKTRQKKLDRLNLSAMIGAGILVLALAIGIIQLVGGAIGGI